VASTLVPAAGAQAQAQSPVRGGVTWAPVVGFGATALAAISYSVAVVVGGRATALPTGRTRAEAQADLERRKDDAQEANGLLIAGTALSAAAIAAFVWWSRSASHVDR
jgi:hypothetical protein